MKVLIVEDRPEIARILEAYLRPFTSGIVTTLTRAEAASVISSGAHLDLVTIDLGLPDSPVSETIEWLKVVREQRPNAVIVVISGMVDVDKEPLLRESGADGFIPKSDIGSGRTFIERMAQIWSSLFGSPTGYRGALPIAEAMTKRFSEYLKTATNE
jgi:CheY-like chemotaxis protein